jgi:hypothetical protein
LNRESRRSSGASLKADRETIVKIPSGPDEVAKETQTFVDQFSALLDELVDAIEDPLSLCAGRVQPADQG